MNHITAMKLALDALVNVRGMHYTAVIPAEAAIAALQAALAEPVAYLYGGSTQEGKQLNFPEDLSEVQIAECYPLYAHPPVPEPLSVEKIKSMDYRGTLDEHIRTVRMVEAAIRGKI
jgi:hypothetical protein